MMKSVRIELIKDFRLVSSEAIIPKRFCLNKYSLDPLQNRMYVKQFGSEINN